MAKQSHPVPVLRAPSSQPGTAKPQSVFVHAWLRVCVRACALLSECSAGLASGSMGLPTPLQDLLSGISMFPFSFPPPPKIRCLVAFILD